MPLDRWEGRQGGREGSGGWKGVDGFVVVDIKAFTWFVSLLSLIHGSFFYDLICIERKAGWRR